MKKGLLLVGALILSTSVFAASAHDAAEGVVEVKAKVVQPLDIKTTPVDYGIMIPGEYKEWAERTGTLKITGTPGEKIRMEVKESGRENYSIYKGPIEHRYTTLTTGSGTAENEKMTADLSIFTPGIQGDDAENGILVLESEGEKEFIINGSLTAAQNQKPGVYNGQIHVRAMYE